MSQKLVESTEALVYGGRVRFLAKAFYDNFCLIALLVGEIRCASSTGNFVVGLNTQQFYHSLIDKSFSPNWRISIIGLNQPISAWVP